MEKMNRPFRIAALLLVLLLIAHTGVSPLYALGDANSSASTETEAEAEAGDTAASVSAASAAAQDEASAVSTASTDSASGSDTDSASDKSADSASADTTSDNNNTNSTSGSNANSASAAAVSESDDAGNALDGETESTSDSSADSASADTASDNNTNNTSDSSADSASADTASDSDNTNSTSDSGTNSTSADTATNGNNTADASGSSASSTSAAAVSESDDASNASDGETGSTSDSSANNTSANTTSDSDNTDSTSDSSTGSASADTASDSNNTDNASNSSTSNSAASETDSSNTTTGTTTAADTGNTTDSTSGDSASETDSTSSDTASNNTDNTASSTTNTASDDMLEEETVSDAAVVSEAAASDTVSTYYWVYDADTTTLTFTTTAPTDTEEGTYGSSSATTQFYGSSYVPWYSSYHTSITKVVIDSSMASVPLKSTAYWFYGCSALAKVEGLSNLDMSSVTTMGYMFCSCSALTTLNLSSWTNTSVTSMRQMFSGCSSLETLDLSGLDVSKVTTLDWAFCNCSSLTTLDVSNWDTSSLQDLSAAFNGCSALTTVTGISDWDVSNVTTLGSTFYKCTSLAELYLSGWDTSKVTTLKTTFAYCTSLTTLDISAWDTSNVTTLEQTFRETSITELDLSGWDVSKVTSLSLTFLNCSALVTLGVSGWDTSKVTTLADAFCSCSALTTLNVSGWDTSNVTTLKEAFYDCKNLTTLNVSNWNVSSVTTLYRTFYGCESLTALDVSGWDTSGMTNLEQTFRGCETVVRLDVSGWDVSSVTTLAYTFCDCAAVTALDVSDWDVSGVTTLGSMFDGCESLTALDVSNWDTSKVTNLSLTFRGCSALTALDLSGWDMTSVTDMNNFFTGCSSLVSLTLGEKCVLKSNWGMTSWAWRQMSSAYGSEDPDTGEITTAYLTKETTEIYNLYSSADNAAAAGTDTFVREFTLTFYANGGSPTSTCDVYGEAVFGENFTITEPTRTGYDFAGWWTTRTGGTELVEGETVYTAEENEDGTITYTPAYIVPAGTENPTEDDAIDNAVISQTVYYAHWTAHTYTLKLVSSETGGSLSIDMEYGSFVSLDTAISEASGFTYEGYVLSSWNTKRNGSGTSYDADAYIGNLTTTDGGTVTLYAQWTASDNYATVTFDTEGNREDLLEDMSETDAESVGEPDAIDSYTVLKDSGAVLGELPDGYCGGLTFMEWRILLDENVSGYETILGNLKSAGSSDYDSAEADIYSDKDSSLLAEKIVYQYKYQYYTYTDADDETLTYSVVKLTTSGTKTIYTYTDADADGETETTETETELDEEVIYYIVARSDVEISSLLLDADDVLTLTAVWSADPSVKVTFNNGVDLTVTSETDEDGETVTTVSGGSAYEYRSVQSGQSLGSLPNTPSKTYYANKSSSGAMKTLIGWYTVPQTDNYTSLADTADYQVTADTVVWVSNATHNAEDSSYEITYYAHWGWRPYFATNGGKLTSSISDIAVEYDPYYSVTLPSVTRDGYDFTYWTVEASADSTDSTDNADNEDTITVILYADVTYNSTNADGNRTVTYNGTTYKSYAAFAAAIAAGTISPAYAAAGDTVQIDLEGWGVTLTANWEEEQTVTVSLGSYTTTDTIRYLNDGYVISYAEGGNGGCTETIAYLDTSTNVAYVDGATYNTTLQFYLSGTVAGLYTPVWKTTDDITYVCTFQGWAAAKASGSSSLYTDESGNIVYVENGTEIAELEDYIVWTYYDSDGNEVTDSSAISAGNYAKKSGVICLAAVWLKEQYTITFDPGDGALVSGSSSLGESVTQAVSHGYYTEIIPGASLDGYIFEGWYTDCTVTCDSTCSCTDSSLCGENNSDCNCVTGVYETSAEAASSGGSLLVSGSAMDENEYESANVTVITGDVTYHAHYSKLVQETELEYGEEGSDTSLTYNYGVKWSNVSNENVDNDGTNLNFHPSTGTTQSATLYIWFELNDTDEDEALAAGTVKIYVPKYIWTDMDGNYTGSTNIATELSKYDPDSTTTSSMLFSYYEEEIDGVTYYVLINNQELTGGVGFTLSLTYTVDPSDVSGGAKTTEGYVSGYDYYEGEVPVRITVDLDSTDGTLDVDETDVLTVEMHTNVNAAGTKDAYETYTAWESDWGDEPEDAEDYVYVIWTLTASFVYTSQPVSFYWSEESVHDGTIVKWLKYSAGTLVPETTTYTDSDGNTVTEEYTGTCSPTYTLSADGSKTSYVLVKYPVEMFSDESLEESGLDVYNQAELMITWLNSETAVTDDNGNAMTDSDGNPVYTYYTESLSVYDTQNMPYIDLGEDDTSASDTDYEEDSRGDDAETGDFTSEDSVYSLTKKNTSGSVIQVFGAQETLANNEESVELEWITTYTGITNGATYDSGTGTYSASTRWISISDGDYGEGDVLYSSGAESDKYYWDPDIGNVALTDDDYQITSLGILVKEYDSTKVNGSWTTPTLITDDPSDYGSVQIYIRYKNKSSYTFYKTVTPAIGSDADYVTVSLPDGVVGYQVYYETDTYKTILKVDSTFEILPTDYVQALIGEDLQQEDVTSIIKNIAHLSCMETPAGGGVVTVSSADTYESGGLAGSVIYELGRTDTYQYTTKYAGTASRDADSGTQEDPIYISAWNYNTTEGYETYMESGVFYDLLPAGTTVSASSVFGRVITGNLDSTGQGSTAVADNYDSLYTLWKAGSSSFLDAVYYDVSFESDWEGSGRTMMIITWTAPETDDSGEKATGVEFWYMLETSDDNVDNKTDETSSTKTNYLAFVNTTSNAAVPKQLIGESTVLSDSTTASSIVESAYSVLKSMYNRNYISYAKASVSYIKVESNSWGLEKTVSGESSYYSSSDATVPGGTYTYKLTYKQSSTAETSSIRFLDVLEYGVNGTGSDWYGTLVSVDVSDIAETVCGYASTHLDTTNDSDDADASDTCDPKVYYSEMARSAFYNGKNQNSAYYATDATDADGNKVWTLASEYEASHTTEDGEADLSAVTAVLVDCTADTANSSAGFVLKAEASFSLTITMQAPSTATVVNEDGEEVSIYDTTPSNEFYLYANKIDPTSSTTTTEGTSSGANITSLNDSAAITLTDVEPVLHKVSDPVSGASSSSATEVYEGDSIDYILTVTNTNSSSYLYDIVLEDTLSQYLEVDTSEIQVALDTSGSDPETASGVEGTATTQSEISALTAAILSAAGTSTDSDSSSDTSSLNWTSLSSNSRVSLSTSTVTTEASDGTTASCTKLTFTISSLEPGATLYIKIPATTTKSDVVIANTASITSVYGTEQNIDSETTYHSVLPYSLPETGSRTLLYLLLFAGLLLAAGLYFRKPRRGVPLARETQ